MKKSKTKLTVNKSTIVSLENIRGGLPAQTSYSCPGDNCLTAAKTCANGPCKE